MEQPTCSKANVCNDNHRLRMHLDCRRCAGVPQILIPGKWPPFDTCTMYMRYTRLRRACHCLFSHTCIANRHQHAALEYKKHPPLLNWHSFWALETPFFGKHVYHRAAHFVLQMADVVCLKSVIIGQGHATKWTILYGPRGPKNELLWSVIVKKKKRSLKTMTSLCLLVMLQNNTVQKGNLNRLHTCLRLPFPQYWTREHKAPLCTGDLQKGVHTNKVSRWHKFFLTLPHFLNPGALIIAILNYEIHVLMYRAVESGVEASCNGYVAMICEKNEWIWAWCQLTLGSVSLR